MRVRDLMTKEPTCCTKDTPLTRVAQLMVEHDCGEIPVIEPGTGRPIGVVTDRDICCRAVAQDKDARALTAGDCMTSPCYTVAESDSLDRCCEVLEEHQIRRVPVVDASGRCCGIVAQADIARSARRSKMAEVIRLVSRPSATPYVAAPPLH
jgi:CBS domain-containing protein